MKNNIVSLGKLFFNLDNIIYLDPSWEYDEEMFYPKICILTLGKNDEICFTFKSEKFDTMAKAELRAKEIIKNALTQSIS